MPQNREGRVDGSTAAPILIPLADNQFHLALAPSMKEVVRLASLVAACDMPILITGESGTGKDVLARLIHAKSHRVSRIFLRINCAAMPQELLESELFGYEAGAFTGATKSKPGKFALAEGGTLFLDEIGEMPAALQAKLLHVLQDGSYTPLGGRLPLKADVRIIAATNVEMQKAIREKQFREDLYYRLCGMSLRVPPLRERMTEVPAFADFFMEKAAKRYAREFRPFTTQALARFLSYSWPGNLRELENVVGRYLILGDDDQMLPESLNSASFRPVKSTSTERLGLVGLPKRHVQDVKQRTEAAALGNALRETKWNRKRAAERYGISYRSMCYKIKEYGLSPANAEEDAA
jgi:two-component system response regulator AtoC